MSIELLTPYLPRGAGPDYFTPTRRRSPPPSTIYNPLARSHLDVDAARRHEMQIARGFGQLAQQFIGNNAGILSPNTLARGPEGFRPPMLQQHTAREMVLGPFGSITKVQAQVAKGAGDVFGRDVRVQHSRLNVSRHTDYWFGPDRKGPPSNPGMDSRLEY